MLLFSDLLHRHDIAVTKLQLSNLSYDIIGSAKIWICIVAMLIGGPFQSSSTAGTFGSLPLPMLRLPSHLVRLGPFPFFSKYDNKFILGLTPRYIRHNISAFRHR